MKSSFLIIKYFIASCFLLGNCVSVAYTEFDDADYCSGDPEILDFMPGQEQHIKEMRLNMLGKKYENRYLRDLKEFTISKNGKYCLWDSKYWNEECQNAAMYYAYGPDWPEFKKLIIKFIKYIQDEEYDKAIAITAKNTTFYLEDNEKNSH
jgi:hypothetical protein